MKAYSHPPRKFTRLHIKDGSTSQKRWLYFRQTFIVESESKAWLAMRKLQPSKLSILRNTKTKNKLCQLFHNYQDINLTHETTKNDKNAYQP